MAHSWRALLVASLALGSTATTMDTAIVVQYPNANLPAGYLTENNNTALGAPRLRVRSIGLADILPSLDSRGNSRCCPLGTVNDGTGCVFPESSVCEPGTRLEGNVCVSDHPPLCPDGLKFNGKLCVAVNPPQCPPLARFNGVACEAESDPICKPPFEFDDGVCKSTSPPQCPAGFTINEQTRLCTSNEPPKCPEKQTFDREAGGCVRVDGPKCPGNSKPEGETSVSTTTLPSAQTNTTSATASAGMSTPPSCPDKFILKGCACVREEDPICSPGFFNTRTKVCEDKPHCPPDYEFVGSVCLGEVPLICHDDTQLVLSEATGKSACCPEGFDFYNGEFCTMDVDDPDDWDCPPEAKYEDGKCWIKPPEPPTCPEHSERIGNECFKKAVPVCPDNGSYTDGKCILPGGPKCPPGLFLQRYRLCLR
ncbi:hypothetical protein MRS44_015315 [Fusarium solani]|uniref:uncharacterized protein n=1 Tax=Fusarium solani TaxID=169388 RepID=UPI0032C4A571|nr:hypothetical protein MRS44_015315 [Fusarium solani]